MEKINTNIIHKLGQKIRIERQKRKMSQEKLAELADLNRNFVGMIERGETNLTIKKTRMYRKRLQYGHQRSLFFRYIKF